MLSTLGVVSFAFSITDWVFYLCTYTIAAESTGPIGELWLWVISAGLVYGAPHFISRVCGWESAPSIAGGIKEKLRKFARLEAHWLTTYCVW